MNKNHPSMTKEVWFFTSELEGERAGSFRQVRWCNIFLQNNYRARVFNLTGIVGLKDVRFDNQKEFKDFRERSEVLVHPRSGLREGFVVKIIRYLKHLLLTDLYRPNVIKLLIIAHRLLSRRKERVVLMVSSPPFSVAVVGALLKYWHGNKVVLAVDMRDAWALHNALGGIKWIKRGIESAVLRRADHVSTVSKWLANEFKESYGINVDVIYNVATHYLDVASAPRIVWSEVSNEISDIRLKLVYTGSTPVGHYDLKSIVSGVVSLRALHPDLASRIQLIFVGACNEVRREAKHQGVIAGDIVFIEHLPHKIVRSVQASADVLLFLAHHGEGNKGVVSTKLFEYLCLGKPVLPLSLHVCSDVDQLLHRYCGVSLNVHSANEIMKSLVSVAESGSTKLPYLVRVDQVKELLDDYTNYAIRLL